LVWEKINQFGNTHILKTNALDPKENPKALRFEYFIFDFEAGRLKGIALNS
jgi:hypothetical protein